MGRPKKTTKAKEPVRIRERKLADGNRSLYLDVYSKGFRKVESLGLYLVPENTPFDKQQNENAMKVAEKVKAERIIAIQNQGVKDWDKIKRSGISLLAWLEQYKESDTEMLSASSTRNRKTMLNKVAEYLNQTGNEGIALKAADEDFCRGFLAYLKNAPKSNSKTSDKTINNGQALFVQTVLSGAFNKAVREGIIDHNPLSHLEAHEKFHQIQTPREFLTIEEIQKAIDTPAVHEPTKRAFLFSCFTGLRLSDIRTLTWSKIQTLPDGSAKFVRVKMQKTQQWIDIPLSEEALRWLCPKKDPEEPIFQLYDEVNIIKHLKKWLEAAGITKHITFHCARHTCATMLLTLGADIYTVSKLLGHSKISTTQIYAKIIDKKKVDAMQLLNGLFNKVK